MAESSPVDDSSIASAAAPLLTFTGVSKRFPDGTTALDGVDISVAPGEFVSVIGPSGCGKSTLLRIASDLTRASAGSVDVQTRKIGYVFQDPTLLPWRTVQGNVELFAELRHLPKAERRRRADAAIALVGLSEFARHRPRALSGGMRMRVSIARALVAEPDLALFDEPFGALDEITRLQMQTELQKLFVLKQFAGLFITHSVSEAVYLSTRVLVMSGRPGRVVADIAVPWDYPRDPTLRYDPEFATLTGRVSQALGEHS